MYAFYQDREASQMEDLTLVAKMVNHPASPNLILQTLKSDSPEMEIDFQELGNDWILFKFSNKEDTDTVFSNRPYHVQNHLLALYSYTQDFRPFETQTTMVDLWARIPFLPLPLFENEPLEYFLREKGVGELIRIDGASNVENKMKFARFCVTVDITRPLVSRVSVRDSDGSMRELRVWYEDYSNGCGCCGGNDHVFEDCPLDNDPPGRIHVVIDGDDPDEAIDDRSMGSGVEGGESDSEIGTEFVSPPPSSTDE